MKLRLIKPFLLGKSNGAEISMLEYLVEFQKRAWDVEVFVALPEAFRSAAHDFVSSIGAELQEDVYVLDGVRCKCHFSDQFHPTDLRAQKAMEESFEHYLKKQEPDIVWSHYTDFFAVSSAVRYSPQKTWVHITDNEYPRMDKLSSFPSLVKSYESIQNVLVASHFMKEQVKRDFPNSKLFVLRRLIQSIHESPVVSSSKHWLFVNPVEVKGFYFLLDLAKACPEQSFLVVGNWGARIEDLPRMKNVEYWPPQKNLRKAFEVSKALLMPSVWQEAFGRLPLEAMAAGLPVIVSDRGALPDTVGRAGLVLPLEISAWKKILDAGQQDLDRVKSYAQQRLQNYKEEARKSLDSYVELVK